MSYKKQNECDVDNSNIFIEPKNIKSKMNMRLVTTLIIWFQIVDGHTTINSPPTLLQSFGCIEKINITLFVYSFYSSATRNLQIVHHLEKHPCFTLFILKKNATKNSSMVEK